jgi:hypothetical protein
MSGDSRKSWWRRLSRRGRGAGVVPGRSADRLTKSVFETALEADAGEYLGYDKYDSMGRNGGNSWPALGVAVSGQRCYLGEPDCRFPGCSVRRVKRSPFASRCAAPASLVRPPEAAPEKPTGRRFALPP